MKPARSKRRADLAKEAKRLNADRADRMEKQKIAELMQSLMPEAIRPR